MADEATITGMRAIAGGLDEVLNGGRTTKDNGFVLLVFPFAEQLGRRTNYISNCDRADVIAALKEVVARLEGQPHIVGCA